jgi:hypothetical protein
LSKRNLPMFQSIPGSLDSTMMSLFYTPSTIDDLQKKEWKQVCVPGYIHCKDVSFVFYFTSSALHFITPTKSKNTYYISYLLQNSCVAGIHMGRLGCCLFRGLGLCSIESIQMHCSRRTRFVIHIVLRSVYCSSCLF